MTDNKTIAVVGGGLAGLTAAAVAARTGARVTLFEQAGGPGGRASTLEREGVLFNVGPHALYRHGAAARIFAELGVEYTGARPRAGGYALLGSRRHRLPAGGASFALSGALSARGKLEMARAYAGLGKLDMHALEGVPLRDWLDETFSEASAKRAFQAFTRVATYANSPEIASAGAALEQLRLGLGGVLYLDGGWQTLVDGLFTVAAAAGAELRTCARVRSVSPEGAGWNVATDDSSAWFDAVVLAVAPGVAAALTGAGAGSALATWASEAVPVRAAVLDVVVSRLPNRGGLFALGFDRPTYFSVHSAWARLAAEGRTLVSTAWYRAPGELHSDDDIERELERSLDLVQPGWRAMVTFRRFLPDLVVANDHVRAATAGFEARPGPEVPGMAGLFVAGDWAGPEGMIGDAAVASGASAAERAVAAAGQHARGPAATVSAVA